MEPRARAGKNVGKANFSNVELTMLLHGHGDVKQPLPETVRVLDEILTDMIHGIAFEASRAAHYSGRQKIKYEDFEFAFRKNPTFLGKVQETFEKQKKIKDAREILNANGDEDIIKDAAEEEKRRKGKEKEKGAGGGAATGASAGRQEEELGEADDDVDMEGDGSLVGKKK